MTSTDCGTVPENDSKSALRARMLSLRDSYDELVRLRAGRLIEDRLFLLEEFKSAGVLSTYVSKASEVRTQDIIRVALQLGKRVIVPITDGEHRCLIFSELRDPESELALGTFGILEPKPESRRLVSLRVADLVLAPGIAWDLRGYRLGYGMAYYDRALRELACMACTIGLSYEGQLVSKLPCERHDVRVKKIVTEKRVINCFEA